MMVFSADPPRVPKVTTSERDHERTNTDLALASSICKHLHMHHLRLRYYKIL